MVKLLLVSVFTSIASGSPGASQFHARLLASGGKTQWPFFGGGGLPHFETDPPPPQFLGDDTCDTKCTFDGVDPVERSGKAVTLKYRFADWTVATAKDWVGLYEVTASNSEYFEYFDASVDWQGVGQRTLSLFNFRTELDLRYMQGSKCLCRSGPIAFALGAEEPTSGHLSLTGLASEMQITWISAAKKGFVEVEGFNAMFPSTVATYGASDMCNQPATNTGTWAWRDPGMIHTATMKGLEHDRTYRYRYGHGNVTSEWATFRTEPEASKEWVAIAYGDMGVHGATDEKIADSDDMPGARLVQLHIQSLDPRLVVHFGDLSYARSCGFVWDIWGNQIEATARTRPYMVSLGNHEYDHSANSPTDPSGVGAGFHPSWGNYGDDSAGECGVPVVYRWPNPPQSGFGLFWYSYNYANTHWVMLSSEHNYTVGADEYEWLIKDLASVDRTRTPWIIVTAHRPAYNSEDYQGDYDVAINLAKNLDPVLVKYKVNLFLAGHYHAYQRTCQVADMKCQPGNATQHITVGSAGATLDYVKIKPEGQAWTKHTSETFGALSLKITPEKLIGEFWGAENYLSPRLPFHLMDYFEVLPWGQSADDAGTFVI